MNTENVVSRRVAVGGMGAALALPLVGPASASARRSVEGKVALVTGSGRNLGRATVLELARRGADVVVNARSNRTEAEGVVREVEALGARGIAVLGDVGNEEDVRRMVDEVLSTFGRIDVLINNAGTRPRQTFRETTTAQWREVLAVNLDGPFFCSKAVVPSMISNGGGRIINVGGLNAMTGTHWAHVCAAKMGTLGLTRALAVELGPFNILVNLVVPGGWDLDAEALEDIDPVPRSARIPLGRPGLAQELANVYAFLASDDASYVTGQMIHVNGGEVRY